MDTGARRAVECSKVLAAKESPVYLLDLRELAFIMRSNSMLFVYNSTRNAFENLTYYEVVAQRLYDFGWDRRLEPDVVRLLRQARDLPSNAQKTLEAPGYGFGDEWRNSLWARDILSPDSLRAADDATIKQSSFPAFMRRCCTRHGR